MTSKEVLLSETAELLEQMEGICVNHIVSFGGDPQYEVREANIRQSKTGKLEGRGTETAAKVPVKTRQIVDHGSKNEEYIIATVCEDTHDDVEQLIADTTTSQVTVRRKDKERFIIEPVTS